MPGRDGRAVSPRSKNWRETDRPTALSIQTSAGQSRPVQRCLDAESPIGGLSDREDALHSEGGVVVERVLVRVPAPSEKGDPQGRRLTGREHRRRAALDAEVVAERGGVS